jgi:hypothetical protein
MRFISTTIAAALAATPVFADGLICERVLSYGAGEVPGHERTFYAHGCDAFQYFDLSAHEVAQLGEHCNIPLYPTDPPPPEGEEAVLYAFDQLYEGTRDVLTQPRGVANGASFDRDNLTSMGVSEFDGQNVVRVRSATDNNPVTLRVAGGGTVWSGTVGAGDTFIATGTGPQTVIAQTGSRSITKATGGHPFSDVGTETYETSVRVEGRAVQTFAPGGEIGGGSRQMGARTDRCGPLGAVIPPRG